MVCLSIVIINYNVRNYLKLCLESVKVAIKGIDAEVFVYDNASSDGSKELFSSSSYNWIHYIYSSDNIGFGRANNIVFNQTTGKYVLILNPDTVVSKVAIDESIRFLDCNLKTAGVGVMMIDGEGTYLKESKRGFPTPWVSFCKLSGLVRLFPKSRLFSGYYLGHLDKDAIHEVPILSGAYMMVRRDRLFDAGLFDERYFMFGEDIDLSYSLLKDGFVNHYLPSCIVHFKGESTKQVSKAYQQAFYGAMSLFYMKYYPKSSRLCVWALHLVLHLLSWISISRTHDNSSSSENLMDFFERGIDNATFDELILQIKARKGKCSIN